jgi:hypothetical protein
MGVANANAWKSYGYNLDNKVTTLSSTDVCTLASGAPKNTQVDGNNGIDNSFGENILPILLETAGNDISKKINDMELLGGKFTVMLDVTGLDGTPTQTATGLSAGLLAGGNYDPTGGSMTPPVDTQGNFLNTDNWPVRPELLTNMSDPKSAKVKFGDSYVVNGTWVNGTPGDVQLNLSIGGVQLNITIHSAIVTFDATTPGRALNGTIAGVLNTQELINALQTVAGRISTSLCPPGQAFQSIATQIQQASDIMHDGTNGPGQACDGISVGLGFESDEIAVPSAVGSLAAPTPDPCTTMMDGGTPQDAAGGG